MARTKSSPKKHPKRTSARKRTVLKPRYRLFLPWPAVFFILLIMGVLFAGWTYQAGAANIEVKGRVPASALTGSAVITNITEGSHFSEIPISLVGTCPLDSYVSIYTNDLYRGSVMCSLTGEFEIDSDLFPGQNLLSARAYNITDDEGPRSDSLEVFYDAPVVVPPSIPPSAEPQVSSPSANTSTSEGAITPAPASPLVLTTNHTYKGAMVGQTVVIELEISGGTSPYALNIEWGDGDQDVVSKKESGRVTAEHVYKKAQSGSDKSYIIKVTAADGDGVRAYLQVFVIINSSAIGSLVANTIPRQPSFLDTRGTVVWVTYGTISLMAISFFLGEREELSILQRLSKRRR